MREPDFIVGDPAEPYLRRWYVIPRNRRFNIYLHQFCHSDDDRALHDHPWVNCSILLSGTYIEWVQPRWPEDDSWFLRRPWRPWAPWRLIFRRASSAHRVELIANRTVWTLFLTGPVIREWGFHCPGGWRHWKEFVATREGGNQTGKGCGN